MLVESLDSRIAIAKESVNVCIYLICGRRSTIKCLSNHCIPTLPLMLYSVNSWSPPPGTGLRNIGLKYCLLFISSHAKLFYLYNMYMKDGKDVNYPVYFSVLSISQIGWTRGVYVRVVLILITAGYQMCLSALASSDLYVVKAVLYGIMFPDTHKHTHAGSLGVDF